MTSLRRSFSTATLMLCTTFLFAVGCGGGGGGGPAPPGGGGQQPPPGGGTIEDVIAEGVVTGFGSVFVNGERYEVVSTTAVDVEGDGERLGDDSALKLGMKVRIDARPSADGSGFVATSIKHRSDLRGPVTRIVGDPEDPTIGTFRIANTPVIVDAETVFDSNIGNNDGVPGIDIRDLSLPQGRMVVRVSGFATAEGYVATRISRLNTGSDDEVKVKGFVTAVDTAASTLTVAGTVFHVNGTEFDDGLVFGPELVGVFVEVEGRIVGDRIVATEVEREDEPGNRRGRLEIEGILLSVDTSVTPNRIQIGGLTVPVTDASALVPLVGSKVKIRGRFDTNGVLVLDRLQQRQADSIRLEDLIASVDAQAGTFTTRLGITIRPDATMRLEDDDDDGGRLTPPQFLSRLRAGDEVEARGFVADNGEPVWTRVERDVADDDDFECELRGPVQAIAADRQSFVILGVTIDVSSSREVKFEDEDGRRISRSAFFDRLAVGDIVKAESDDDDPNACRLGVMVAEEVEFRRVRTPTFPTPDPAPGNGAPIGDADVVFLVIDEDSIDNGNPPNNFTATEVNDDIAAVGQRQPLRWFAQNVGSSIDLFTGQVGDEGWFALKTIPVSWQDAGPTGNGVRNYLLAGPGLGAATGDDREVLLDAIPDVTPLRATGLAMLVGRSVCALVYDSDVGINYSPLQGNLQGATLGVVAFDVTGIAARTDGSSSDLPRVSIEVRDPALCDDDLFLFRNAPVPASSSEPFDITPPAVPPAPQFIAAP